MHVLTARTQVDKKRLNTVKESIKQGFSWATREGPLCEERKSLFIFLPLRAHDLSGVLRHLRDLLQTHALRCEIPEVLSHTVMHISCGLLSEVLGKPS
jgi:hypothetical protein